MVRRNKEHLLEILMEGMKPLVRQMLKLEYRYKFAGYRENHFTEISDYQESAAQTTIANFQMKTSLHVKLWIAVL